MAASLASPENATCSRLAASDPFRGRPPPSLPFAAPVAPDEDGVDEAKCEEEDLVHIEALWTESEKTAFGEEHTVDVSSVLPGPRAGNGGAWSEDFETLDTPSPLGFAEVMGDLLNDEGLQPGPRTKGETLKEFLAERAGAWAEEEAAHPSTAPRPPVSADPVQAVIDTAARFGCTEAEFLFALNYDLTHIDMWHSLACSEDSDPLLPDEAQSKPETACRPFPPVPGPASTAAPTFRQPQPVRVPPAHLWPQFRSLTPGAPLPSHLTEPEGGWPIFEGTFRLWNAFRDPASAEEQVQQWQDAVLADARRMREAVRQGREPKSHYRKTLVFGPEDFLPFIPGLHIRVDTDAESPYDSCSFWEVADVRVSNEFTIDGATMRADMGDESCPDQELAQALEYGTDSKSDSQPWGLVLCPMNGSAAEDLGVLEKTLDKALDPDNLVGNDGCISDPALALTLERRAAEKGTSAKVETAAELDARSYLAQAHGFIQSIPAVYEPYG